jgi:hypothetical protein
VILILFILASCAAVVYLARTKPEPESADEAALFALGHARARNASTSTAATQRSTSKFSFLDPTKPGGGHARDATTDTTAGRMKGALAGMFRSFGGRTRGWERTAGADDDAWGADEPFDARALPPMAELGLRAAPAGQRVVVTPTHARAPHASEHAAAYADPYAPAPAPAPYAFLAHAPAPAPAARRESDDLSETSTVFAREPSVRGGGRGPQRSGSAHSARRGGTGSGSGRPPHRRGSGASVVSQSPPASFYSARAELSPERIDEEELAGAHTPQGEHEAPLSPLSPAWPIDGGTRFREAL